MFEAITQRVFLSMNFHLTSLLSLGAEKNPLEAHHTSASPAAIAGNGRMYRRLAQPGGCCLGTDAENSILRGTDISGWAP